MTITEIREHLLHGDEEFKSWLKNTFVARIN